MLGRDPSYDTVGTAMKARSERRNDAAVAKNEKYASHELAQRDLFAIPNLTVLLCDT